MLLCLTEFDRIKSMYFTILDSARMNHLKFLIRDMLQLICLLHIFTYYLILQKLVFYFVFYYFHICYYWLYI